MSDNLGVTKKRGTLAPWLIGCGLAIVLAIVGLGGAGYYWWKTSMFFEDADITAVAAKILPGARAPQGLEPFWGMDTFGVQIAVFGPPGMNMGDKTVRSGMTIVVASNGGKDGSVVDSMGRSASGEEHQIREVKEIGEEVMSIGGADITVKKSRAKQDDRDVLIYVARFHATGPRRPVVMVMGPEKTFDRKMMDAFFAGIGPLAQAAEDSAAGENAGGKASGEPGSGKTPAETSAKKAPVEPRSPASKGKRDPGK